MPRCRVGPFLWVAVLSVRVAAGQAASHREFQVNTVTTGYQTYPSVAAFDSGFVVVWDSTTQDGDGRGVFARRYDFNGVPGPVFQVNQYTTGWQWRAGVAAAPNGTFVVTWHSPVPGGGYGVFARRYDAFGPPSPEFAVHASTESVVSPAAIAMDPAGRFVVVWSAPAPEGGHDVFGRAYDPSGFPYGSEFRVNAYTSGYQWQPDVAMDNGGGFVVAWEGADDGHESGVFGRRFGLGAVPLGGDLAVNTYTTGGQYAPAVAVDSAGSFVVAYIGGGVTGDIFARRYSAGGTPLGGEFRVNEYTPSYHSRPIDVAFDDDRNFIVAWDSTDEIHWTQDVMGRAFDAGGSPLTGDFRINTSTIGGPTGPALAFDRPDHFVAVWTRWDGSGPGVFGRRFDPDRIFADGFESGDLSAWSAAAVDGGDLTGAAAAALRGSNQGLRGVVDDVASLYVQDDSPHDENRYRARFYLDPNGFDPGEASGARRTRVFILFEEDPVRRLAAVVLRRVAGTYAIMLRARLDDNTQYDTGFFTISDAEHFVELDWKRSSAADANDGSVELWIDGVSVHSAATLDNSRSAVDFVRLGALSVKPTAAGVLHWDEFESRRITSIGP